MIHQVKKGAKFAFFYELIIELTIIEKFLCES